MSELDDHIVHLKEKRRRYLQSLRFLELQKANYGVLDVPVRLVNEIDQTQIEVNTIEQELVRLGQLPNPSTTHDILERLSTLEREVAELRLLVSSNKAPNAGKQLSPWFNISDTNLALFPRGDHVKQYQYDQLITTSRDIYHDVTISGDGRIISLTISTTSRSLTTRVYDTQSDWDQGKLYIFHTGGVEPAFITSDDQLVYSGPVFSSDNRYIAFAYAHDFRASQIVSDAQIPNEDGITEPLVYETVDWKESVAIIDTLDWKARILHTEQQQHGWSKWAETHNFFDLRFIRSDTILFGITATRKGIEYTWKIPITDGAVQKIPNPGLAEYTVDE